MKRRLMTLAAASCSFFLVASASVGRGEDTPAPPPLYWTFPVSFDFLELDGSAVDQPTKDPFIGGGDIGAGSLSPTPPKTVTWGERPEFFGVGSIYDASPLLRKAGIPLQEGKDLAFFHKADQRLYVRCSREAADLIDQFTSTLGPCGIAKNIEIDLLLIGLNDTATFHALANEDDPRAMAETLAADTGHVLARSSILTRSGQRAAIGQVGPGESWPVSLGPGDKPSGGTEKPGAASGPGLRLEVEPTLGADGNTIDLALQCSFGLRPHPAEGPLITGRLTTAVTLQSGRALLQRLSLEGAPWTEAAVLLTATVKGVDAAGWKDGVRQPTFRELRWRALGESPEKSEPSVGNH